MPEATLDPAAVGLRMVITAAVVIGTTIVAGRLGPRIGGLLVGLPIVAGPAFFFLMLRHTPAFVAETAAYTAFALTGTLAFCMVFIQLGGRGRGLAVSLLGASLAWLAVALVSRQFPPWPLLAAASYGFWMLIGIRLARPFVQRLPTLRPQRSWGELVLRGLTASLLVGVVSAFAASLGPSWSGMILGFPVALFVVSWTLFQRYGGQTAVVTMASAQVGMAAIVVFTVTLALLAERLSLLPLFALATGLSLVPSLITSFAGRASTR